MPKLPGLPKTDKDYNKDSRGPGPKTTKIDINDIRAMKTAVGKVPAKGYGSKPMDLTKGEAGTGRSSI